MARKGQRAIARKLNGVAKRPPRLPADAIKLQPGCGSSSSATALTDRSFILDYLFDVAPVKVLLLCRDTYKHYIPKLYQTVKLDQPHQTVLYSLGPDADSRKPLALAHTSTLVFASGWAMNALSRTLPSDLDHVFPLTPSFALRPIFGNLKHVLLTWAYVNHYTTHAPQARSRRTMDLPSYVEVIRRHVRAPHLVVDVEAWALSQKPDSYRHVEDLVSPFLPPYSPAYSARRFPPTSSITFRVSDTGNQDAFQPCVPSHRYNVQFVPEFSHSKVTNRDIACAIWQHSNGQVGTGRTDLITYFVSDVERVIAELIKCSEASRSQDQITDITSNMSKLSFFRPLTSTARTKFKAQLRKCIKADTFLDEIGFKGDLPDFDEMDQWDDEDRSVNYYTYAHWKLAGMDYTGQVGEHPRMVSCFVMLRSNYVRCQEVRHSPMFKDAMADLSPKDVLSPDDNDLD